MVRARLLVLTAAVAVSLACGKIAGIEDPPAATTAAGADGDIQPAEIVFGDVSCGTEAPAPQVIALANTTSEPVDYKVELPDGTPFRLEGPLTGTIQPRAAAVTIKAFVTANASGDITSAVLVSVGPVVKNVPLHATGHGAVVQFDPILAAMGDVRMQSGGSADVVVHNRGDADLVISGFTSDLPDFSVAKGGAVTVGAGKDATLTVQLEPDTKGSDNLKAELKPQIVGAVCGSPGGITATGRRVSSDVTISSGDFGKQPCNTTPTKDVVISNYTMTVLDYTATLPAGSPFTIVSGASGSVGKGSFTVPQTAAITVAPAASLTTLAPLADTLTVTINGVAAPAGGAHAVPIALDVRGAVLTAQPVTITNFQSIVVNWRQYTDVRNVQVSNTGNEAVSINWNLKRVQGDPAWVWSFPGSLNPGQAVTAQVGFSPTGNCPCESTGTPTATAGGPICNALSLDWKGSN